jgi:hypothetical protein
MEDLTSPTTSKRRPSDARILATQISVCFAIGFAAIYIVSSYLQRSTFENLLSFYGPDGPGMYPNAPLPNPFGVHFFGDFLLPQWQSILSDPWIYKEAVGPPVNNYLPFTMGVFWIFAQFTYWNSFIAFLVSSILIFGYPLLKVLRNYTGIEKAQIILSSVVLTGPMISLLDRGNLQFLMIGFCVLATHAFVKKRYWIAAVLFGLAIAMKAYPIVFLIFFIRGKKWRHLFLSAGTAFVATWIPLIFYAGSPIQILKSVWENIRIWGDVYDYGYLAYNNSVRGFLISVESLQIPILSPISSFLYSNIVFSLTVIGLLAVFVLLCPKVPPAEIALVGVALICCLVDFVPPYVLGMYFVAFYFLWDQESQLPKKWLVAYGWLLAVLLMPRGIPVEFWNSNFAFDQPTYTSLLGGICSFGIIMLVFIRHFNRQNLRSVMGLNILKKSFIDS